MLKINFICHGNICRSPIAEFVFKDMIKKQGRENEFSVCSMATSSEEIFMGELKHGPLALINDNFPCIIINSSTLLDEVVNNSIEEIKARKGKIFTFNVDNNYSLSFLLQVYFGDLLALHVGRIKGVNIDKPRNLAKSVTVE